MVAVSADMHAARASVKSSRRLGAAVSGELAVMGVDSGSGVGGILINGVLHLA